jgi:hypothetical protein
MFTNARYYDYPGENPLVSSPVMEQYTKRSAELRKRMAEINAAIEESMKELMAERAKVNFEAEELLRTMAREAGFIATDLASLTALDGSSFVHEKNREHRSVQRAYSPNREHAYLCKPTDETAGCGWVKGRPKSVGYSDIAPLSGSAGANYFCVICHKRIGRQAFVWS